MGHRLARAYGALRRGHYLTALDRLRQEGGIPSLLAYALIAVGCYQEGCEPIRATRRRRR